MSNDIFKIVNKIFDFLKFYEGNLRIINNLSYYFGSQEIEKNKIKFKSVLDDFFLKEIKLTSNKYLLIYDKPVNVYLFYTILIGIDTDLYEFKLKSNPNNIYYSSKEILDLFKKDLIINSLKKVNSEIFQNQDFNEDFQPDIIKEYRKFILENKKIDLSKIHLIKGDKIELFCPNFNKKHLLIATDLKLPAIKLLNGGIIRKTNIEVFDKKRLYEKINPIKLFQRNSIVPYYKYNKLYTDISKQYLLILKNIKSKLIKFVKNSLVKNSSANEIIKSLKDREFVKISTENKTDFPLLIWNNEVEKLIPKDIKEFKEMTGLDLKVNMDFLNKIFLMSKNASKLNFSNKYLISDLYRSILNEDKLIKDNRVFFKTEKELFYQILVLLKNNKLESNYNLIKVTSKVYSTNKIDNLLLNNLKILRKLVLISIKEVKNFFQLNKNEKIDIDEKLPFTNLLKYYFYELKNLNKKFIEEYNYKEILKLYEQIQSFLLLFLKKIPMSKFSLEHSYLLFSIYNELLYTHSLLFNFNVSNKKYIKLNLMLNQFFKVDISFLLKNYDVLSNLYYKLINNHDINYDNLYLDKGFLQILYSKKKKFKLILNKENVEVETYVSFLKNKNIELVLDYSNESYYLKPNIREIKKTFKYNFNEILVNFEVFNRNLISKERLINLKNNQLKFLLKNKKLIKLDEKYFYKIYTNLRINNELFKLSYYNFIISVYLKE